MANEKVNSVSSAVESNEKYAADLDQALAVAGVGFYNMKYCIVLALFLIAGIVEVIGYSYILPAAKCDLNISDSQRGFIASLPYIAIVLMSFFWGYLVDTRGRRKILLISSLICGCFGIVAAFMPEMISFTVCKFIASLCLACPCATPYTFIGEIVPLRQRDLTLSIVNAMQMMGSALVPLLAWGILPLEFRVDFGAYDFRSWRLLTIIYSCILLFCSLLLYFGPESPKYLVSQGKYEEALQVLQNMYAGNKGKSPEDYPIKHLKSPVERQIEKKSVLNSLKVQSLPLIKPPYLKWMALNGFLLFGIFASLNGLFMWVPDVLNRVLTSGGEGMTACQVIAQRFNESAVDGVQCNDTIDMMTFTINSIANISCALIAVAISAILKFIGKKTLLVLMYFILGTFCILINFITHNILFAVLLSSLQVTAVGIGPVNAYAVEIFPTRLRGMAVSLSFMLGRIGSMIGTNVAGIMINATCEATFYSFGGLLLLCGLLTFLLPKSKQTENKTINTKL